MKKLLCIINANTVKSRDPRTSWSFHCCSIKKATILSTFSYIKMLWHFSRPNRTVKSDWSGPLIFCKEQFFKLPQYTAHRLTCLDLVCDNCGKDFRSEVDKTNVKGHHVVFQRAKRKWLECHAQNAVCLRSYSAVLGLLFIRNFLGAIVYRYHIVPPSWLVAFHHMLNHWISPTLGYNRTCYYKCRKM